LPLLRHFDIDIIAIIDAIIAITLMPHCRHYAIDAAIIIAFRFHFHIDIYFRLAAGRRRHCRRLILAFAIVFAIIFSRFLRLRRCCRHFRYFAILSACFFIAD
jgi:hypothetical protein